MNVKLQARPQLSENREQGSEIVAGLRTQTKLGLSLALSVALLISGGIALGQYTKIEVPKGYVQLQGDIITTEEAAAELRAEMQADHPSFVYAASRLWPNRTVPYDFDPSVTPAQQAVFLAAMAAWQNSFPGVTTVIFQPRNIEPGHLHLVVADPGFLGGSTDYVGFNGRRVTMTVHPNAVGTWLIAHELGHALGLWHEQTRNDRDGYVTIVAANILDGFADQFDKASPQSTFGPYDYDSIMHYGPCSFSICDGQIGHPSCNCPDSACATIQPVSQYSAQQCSMGQRAHLSAMDQRSMAFMYGPPNWSFLYVRSGSLATGSFQNPYQTMPQVVADVSANSTLWIGPGSYSAAGTTLSKPMTLRAAIADLQLQPDGSLGPSPSGYARLQ
jgi:hypothetical protein